MQSATTFAAARPILQAVFPGWPAPLPAWSRRGALLLWRTFMMYEGPERRGHSPPDPPDDGRCLRCGRPLTPGWFYCAGCGVRVGSPVRLKTALLTVHGTIAVLVYVLGVATGGLLF